MSELPEGWVKTTLGKLLTPKGYIRGPFGSALKRGDMEVKGIPVYEQQNAIYNHRQFRYFIGKEKYNKLKRFTVRPNDMVISCSGTLGRVTMIQEKDPIGIISQALLILRHDSKKITHFYLKYFLTSQKGYNSMISRSSGSVQINLAKREVIENIPFNLPPLPEQKAIAAVLSAFDDKIELLREQNQTLEILAQTIFKEWFVHFNFPDQDGKPYRDNGGEMVDSELGEIPKGWRVVKISDLFDVRDGTHDSPKQNDYGYYLITSKHLLNHTLDFDSAYFISEDDYININKRSLAERYDILFSMIGTLGLTYLEQSININYAIKNVGLFKTSQNEKWVFYTYLWLSGVQGRNYISSNKSGSTQEYMSLTSLRNISYCMPAEGLLNLFNEIMKVIFKKIKNNAAQIQTLSKTRDTLLPKLMSGETRVKGFEQ